MTHELSMRRKKEIPNAKNKGLALKASKNNIFDSKIDPSDMEDVVVAKNFYKKFRK